MGKIAMLIESQAVEMSNVSLMVGNASGMLFNISPVKYDEHPQIMMQVMSVDPQQGLPVATLFYEIGDEKHKLEFALPIYNNKFIAPVEMPFDRYTKFYNDYTTSTNPTFYKLDHFIKNPAPPQVPIKEVIKKAGDLLSNGMNLNVQGFPDMNNLTMVWSAG